MLEKGENFLHDEKLKPVEALQAVWERNSRKFGKYRLVLKNRQRKGHLSPSASRVHCEQKIFRAASITFFDQLALSFVQFFVGMAFVYWGSPEEYGLYTFLMAI